MEGGRKPCKNRVLAIIGRLFQHAFAVFLTDFDLESFVWLGFVQVGYSCLIVGAKLVSPELGSQIVIAAVNASIHSFFVITSSPQSFSAGAWYQLLTDNQYE